MKNNGLTGKICAGLIGLILFCGTIKAQEMNIAQTLSDQAQRTTLAFSSLAMMTGNLYSQSFYPPGKVADYTGFQYLRDNDPDNMGHNTSFLTRVANNVIYVLNDSQFTQLKTLATAQLDQINLYGYKRFALMKAFRRLMDGDVPSGSTGLDIDEVKRVSRELYIIDGQISFDRAILYAGILNSLDAAQKAYLDEMKGKGWNSWPDITNDQIRTKMQGLPQGTAVAVMTYAGDLFSWYAGSLDADVYFCPERQGTYFGSFYIKDAPAIGHEGYSINEQLTATAGSALCDSSKGYVTAEQAASMSSLVDTQRNNLYAGTYNIVSIRTQIATLLRSLLVSTASSDSILTQVLELSAIYGNLDGENNYNYATVFSQVYKSLSTDQKTQLAALRKSIMSGTYSDGTPFDFSVCTTPFLYSAVISDLTLLTPYISNTDYLFSIPASPFAGNIVLGSPTSTSIKIKVSSETQSGTAYVEYGRTPGIYSVQTVNSALLAGTPLELALTGLSSNTQYYYRLCFQSAGESGHSYGSEHSFHTARPAGNTFTFTVQADSHLDDESNLDLYRTTLGNVLADAPDFHLDLGDTFMCEKHSEPFTAVLQTAPDWATVKARYAYEQANFSLMSHSVPLFLVNGNHEGELGWFNDGTANNLAVWSTQARQQYFLNPVPDGFYSGDLTEESFVGKRASWYAWNWGDALFIVLDPYWNSRKQAGSDPWNITLGETQYDWLKNTLSSSTATFKFVFVHNLVGGLDGQMRGGIEGASYFEWGGRNLDGTDVFSQKRPGWDMPIHQLLVQYGVTAVFHGHDHLYAKQELDGVVYQEVPQPSTTISTSGTSLAAEYHYASGTILSSSGHLRVTVSPDHVTTQYVRAWLPENETAQNQNGKVDDKWSIGATGWPTASFTFPNTNIIGQTVNFTDTSTGSPSAWGWDFGDGSTSTDQNPTHTYSAAGTFTVSLTVTNTTGSHTTTSSLTVSSTTGIPATAFTFTPAAPSVGQTVNFTDTSTGSPTTWIWKFGDGLESRLQNPSHVYSSAGTFEITLRAGNASGSKAVKKNITVNASTTPTAFSGNIVLGCPTSTSIKANIFSPNQSGSVYIEYGTSSGTYSAQTTPSVLQPAFPLELPLSGLSANTRYYYRLCFQSTGESDYGHTGEYTFHTARSTESTFTFCIQGDSHPERENSQFNSELYTRTLLAAAADKPDFYLTIGDDFSVDQLDPATVTASKVLERYTIQRPYLGLIGRSAPVFLVNGNHEQGARYLWDADISPDKNENVATWAQNARNSCYSQPSPDTFYTGNDEHLAGITGGYLRNYFAWTWGDALFVTIDPYWASTTCVDDPFDGGPKRSNIWDVTHGDAQYQWLKATLKQSHAKYKFVFAHHVMGTGRGGIELAGQYEWGDTTSEFSTKRPNWTSPIHQLMAENNVTIFFQGHDHIWVRQELDGVTYQTLPEPADPNYSLCNDDAFLTGDKFPNTGYTRVTVSPSNVKVDYVRTYLSADEGTDKVNGSIAFSYSLSPTVYAPEITSFTVPENINTLNVPITSFNVNDYPVVTGYMITLTSTPPTATASTWTAVKPTSFSVPSVGINTLYAWVKDSAGNISSPATATVNIDMTAPVVSAFTLKSPMNSLTIPVTSFTVTEATGIGGYLITESYVAPTATLATWQSEIPTSYTVTTTGSKTLYAWVKDTAGNVSSAKYATCVVDMTKPVVSTFTVPSISVSKTVTGIAISASDNVSVGSYQITESATAPDADSANWKTPAPTTYVFDITATDGSKTLYAWAKDTAGNVSLAKSANLTLDTTAPEITSFTIPSVVKTLSVPITTFTASDSGTVTGYMITITSTPPLPTASTWTAIKPTTFSAPSAGIKTLYAWTKDGLGNVSSPATATVNIDMTVPVVSAFAVKTPVNSLTIPVTSFTVTEATGVAGYLITESSVAPTATLATWQSEIPTSYTVATTGSKILYAWAKDTAGNVSSVKYASCVVDMTKPVVSTFTVPSISKSKTVTGVAVSASDNVSVGSYQITESATAPDADSANWKTPAPTTYVFDITATDGTKTLYAWAKDTAGNVSLAKSATLTLDTTAPSITSFTVPSLVKTLSVPITTFTASDSGAVTGYMITITSTPPLPTASTWTAIKPTTFSAPSAGLKTLYAWVKDSVGNVSSPATATVNIDMTVPVVSAFTVKTPVNSLTIPITSFTVTEATGVAGYLITESSVAPTATLATWKSEVPASYTVAATGSKILYAWAKDTAGNVSSVKYASCVVDMTKPVVSTFTVPSISKSKTVAGIAISATDNVAVAAYQITESATAPDADSANWKTPAPTTYVFDIATSDGSKTLYAWAKDSAGNVSLAKSATLSLDTTAPQVTAFTIPSLIKTLSVPITTFSASDNGTVTGYMITLTSTPPLPTVSTWTAAKPTTYTVPSAGLKTLYAWVKDSAGNVSTPATATVNIDMTAPVVSAFTLKSPVNSLTIPVTSFTVTEATGVAGYLITESSVAPTATLATWQSEVPTSHTVATTGSKTLYAWVKDTAGNVSSAKYATCVVDMTKPVVSAFTVPSISKSKTVAGIAISASDNVSVGSYQITESSTAPDADSANWKTPYPTTYAFDIATTDGSKTLYAWAKDTAGNVSLAKSATLTLDTTAPQVTAFTVPSLVKTLSVPITTFSASDNGTVTGYMITLTSTPPLPTVSTWTAVKPTTYTVPSAGLKTLYAWVKDSTGNVSSPATATVNIDMTAPVVSVFSISSLVKSLNIPVTALTANDNTAVTGYLITESSTTPALTATGWNAIAPTSYPVSGAGIKRLYAWARDAAGNVSLSKYATCTVEISNTPAFNMEQTISDGAQRTTLAFAGLAMMTGNLESQTFFPPGKVADYTGFQYLRDNDPDNMGHNTSFLTRVAENVIYILDDDQLAQLADLAVAQEEQFNLYGYKRYPLMEAFRRLLEGDIPTGSPGLNLNAVKKASRELYILDGQISFDRALLYANILNSLDAAQKAYLDAMKGKGWNSWPDTSTTEYQAVIKPKMQSLPRGSAVLVMTYASDLFSWYAGSVEADVYFCPERHGTYYGSFYIKDAPAIGHEGYSIDEQLTATAGSALCDSSKGYVTTTQAALMSGLVETQRDNLYAGSSNIVDVRTQIATLLRGLLASTASSDSVEAQVLELSSTYGDLDGENNYHYATVFAEFYNTLSVSQKIQLATLRKSIMSGKYSDGTPFDFSVCTTPFLYSGVITDLTLLDPYIGNTDYLFFEP